MESSAANPTPSVVGNIPLSRIAELERENAELRLAVGDLRDGLRNYERVTKSIIRGATNMAGAARPVAVMPIYDEDGVAYTSAVVMDNGSLFRLSAERNAREDWRRDVAAIPGTAAAIIDEMYARLPDSIDATPIDALV